MLASNELCILTTTTGKWLALSAQQAAYGLMSGQVYDSNAPALDRRDLNRDVLIFWKSYPVTAITTFVGRIPSAENVFDIEVCITFAVDNPLLLFQHRLRDSRALSVDRFSEEVAERVRWLVSRLACEFSPNDLVERARAESQHRLLKALAEIYGPEGLSPTDVHLVKVENCLQGRELQLLLRRIELESREAGIALEDAFDRERAQLDDAAQEGQKEAQTLAAQVRQAGSYQELNKRMPEAGRSVRINSENTGAVVTTSPIAMGFQSKLGGRFAVLSCKEQPRYYEILRPWFCLGRDVNCHIQLPSPGVSSLHCTIARVGSGLLVIDHSSTNGTYCSGERIGQVFVQTGDVLRIGDHWVIFKLEPGQETLAIDHSLRGTIASAGGTLVRVGHADSPVGAEVRGEGRALVRLVSSSGRMVSSESRPILIGRDSACELCLDGGGIARFHGVVYWDVDLDARGGIRDGGVYVEDLHSGRGIVLNGRPVSERAKTNDGDILEMGGHRITVTFAGDIRARAKSLHATEPSLRGLAITCIEGSAAGATLRFKNRMERAVIGSGEHSDLLVAGDGISRRHAEIVARSTDHDEVQFFIADCSSTNGTCINGKRLQPNVRSKISPGDIIRVSQGKGCCDLLVHHGL